MPRNVKEKNQILEWRVGWAPGTSWVSEKASAFVNIAADTMVMVTRIAFALRTPSDNATVEFGYTSAAEGVGDITSLTTQRILYTPADLADVHDLTKEVYFDPPIAIRYSDGARTACFAAKANDANAALNVEWEGWWEAEE